MLLALLFALPLAGHWTGDVRQVLNFIRQNPWRVEFEIGADGTLRGRLHDAVLVDGRVKKVRRTWYRHGDWQVTARLEGPIVAAGQVSRRSVRFLLKLERGALAGFGVTSGPHLGTRKRMQITLTGLRLSRSQASPP